MLRQRFRHSFSPCVGGREVLAFTGSRIDALSRTRLGDRIVYFFAEKQNIQT